MNKGTLSLGIQEELPGCGPAGDFTQRQEKSPAPSFKETEQDRHGVASVTLGVLPALAAVPPLHIGLPANQTTGCSQTALGEYGPTLELWLLSDTLCFNFPSCIEGMFILPSPNI